MRHHGGKVHEKNRDFRARQGEALKWARLGADDRGRLRLVSAPALIVGLSLLLAARPVFAGAIIVGGDDLPLHGSFSGGANHQGWLYIQKAIQHLSDPSCATRPNDGTIAALGVTDSTDTSGNLAGGAGAAIHYAAGVALGKTVVYVNGAAAIHTYLLGVAGGTNRPAVIWLPQNYDIANQLDNAETAQLATDAAILRDFVNTGGALMAHTEGNYPGFNPWIGVIVPGLKEVAGCASTGATLTATGTTVLLGVLNSDIDGTAGPCHTSFTGLGSLNVLALDGAGKNYIIGGDCNTTIPGASVDLNKDFKYHKLDSNPDPNNFEMVVAGAHSTANFQWNYNDHGPIPPTATPYPTASGPNTLLKWTLTNTAQDGEVVHVGFGEHTASIDVLSVFWTFNDTVLQCAHQVNITGDSTSGLVRFRNTATLCESTTLYVGNIAVEYYTNRQNIALLNSTTVRNPIRRDIFPGGPLAIPPGGTVEISFCPPDQGVFRVVTYTVSTSPTLSAPDNTTDFWQQPMSGGASVPALGELSVVLLILLLGTTGILWLRRRNRSVSV